MFGNRFWKDFGVEMEEFLGPNWPSEATSKASVMKYGIQEGSESFDNPRDRNFQFWAPVSKGNRESLTGRCYP